MMKDDNFSMLLAVLKKLESMDISKASTEAALVGLIDYFEKDMTEEQKSRIVLEFINYEKIRETEKLRQKETMEKESDRENINSYFSGH